MRFPVNRTWPLAALIVLTACGGGASIKDVPPPAANGPAADYPMVLGSPFVVDGVTYTPADTLNYDAVGIAGVAAEGGATVSGSHRTLPLPSYVEVTALDSGKTILVRMERRGPMNGAQLIELSTGAAAQLGMTGTGRNAVRVRRVNPPEVERAMLRSGQQAPARMDTPKSLLAVLQRKLDAQMGVVTPSPAPETVATPTPTPVVVPVAKPAVKAAPVVKAEKPKPTPVAVKPPEVAQKPAATPKPDTTAKSAAPAQPAGRGTWYVQIGTFASKANAEAAAKKAGASLSESGKLWRVRLGPFADADKAKPALAKARSAGYSDARIQRAD